jgi:hypothetical protein
MKTAKVMKNTRASDCSRSKRFPAAVSRPIPVAPTGLSPEPPYATWVAGAGDRRLTISTIVSAIARTEEMSERIEIESSLSHHFDRQSASTQGAPSRPRNRS